jgi:hypothetical protein
MEAEGITRTIPGHPTFMLRLWAGPQEATEAAALLGMAELAEEGATMEVEEGFWYQANMEDLEEEAAPLPLPLLCPLHMLLEQQEAALPTDKVAPMAMSLCNAQCVILASTLLLGVALHVQLALPAQQAPQAAQPACLALLAPFQLLLPPAAALPAIQLLPVLCLG